MLNMVPSNRFRRAQGSMGSARELIALKHPTDGRCHTLPHAD
jgi:hypothetical protein